MENNYWIEDDLLIFKPSFNEKLTDYYVIINKYKKVMFSNYNDPLIVIKQIIYITMNLKIIMLKMSLIKK